MSAELWPYELCFKSLIQIFYPLVHMGGAKQCQREQVHPTPSPALSLAAAPWKLPVPHFCFLGNTQLFVWDVCSKINGHRLHRSLTTSQKWFTVSLFIKVFSLKSFSLGKPVVVILRKVV